MEKGGTMYWKIGFVACLLWSGLAFGLDPITKEEVSAVINVLASDDMEGRKAGTEGARKAAAYIIEQFKNAGLVPAEGMANLKGYRHTFDMVERAPGEATLVLNGNRISDASFAFRFGGGEIHLSNTDGLETVVIGAKDNLRAQAGNLLRSEKPTLILIDPVQRGFFERLKSYLSSPNMVAKEDRAAMSLWVVTEDTTVESLDFKAKNENREVEFANVVAKIPGKKANEVVMFSAHYDHLGRIKAVDGDDIANGADDDGSGVTAMIMLARHFASGPKPERALLFIAFTAEESGTLGSRAFAQVVKPDEIVAGINMEMVGKPSKFGKGQLFVTGYERSDLGELFKKNLEGTDYDVHPDPYPDLNLFFRSDNAPFARLGVPAHSFSTVQIDKDKLYHTVNDEVETLDMEHFTAAINAIAAGAKGLVYGSETPKRLEKQ